MSIRLGKGAKPDFPGIPHVLLSSSSRCFSLSPRLPYALHMLTAFNLAIYIAEKIENQPFGQNLFI